VGRRRVLDLTEQHDLYLDFDRLASREALAIASDALGRVEVVWPNPSNGRRWILRAKGWVGTLPIGDDLTVRVTPKLPVPRLFELWTSAGGGPSLRLLEGMAPTATIGSALDTVLGLLCKRIGLRIARGLRKAYAPARMSGQSPRGKVSARETVRSFSSGRPILVWDERPLTADVDDRKSVAWTLRQASRLAPRDGSANPEIVRFERHLAALTTPRPFEARDCRGRSYDRSCADYEELHALCALVLDGVGPAAGRDRHHFLSFGAYMPTLFERAVAVLLGEATVGLKIVVNPKIAIGGGFRFEPDLVVADQSGRPVAVIDTKYKAGLVDTDVQQIVAYAAALSVETAFLVYPAPVKTTRLRAGGITVVPTSFDLGLAPADAASHLADIVRREITPTDRAMPSGARSTVMSVP
jgi:5-methylcytosine-specific restriction enzyme subunit McrC